MSFTPSNLTLVSLGSAQLIIARVDGSITSGTNNWNSGIPDILTVSGQYRTATTDVTGTSLAISFTGSSGVIWTIVPVGQSGTSFDLTVLSGFGTDMTW